MAKVCVLIPFTTMSACGIQSPYRNAYSRNQVTCKACKKTEHYKNLLSVNNKTKREMRK